MAAELQHLIDRIQTDGVDKANKEAAAIASQAKDKAAALVAEGEAKAKAYLQQAEKDAEAFTERSITTLEQAARDLLISVGQGVENLLADVVGEAVSKAMSPDVLEQMLVKMSEAYVARGGSESKIDVLLSAEDQAKLVAFFKDRYQEKLGVGVELHADSEVLKGFHVSFKEGQVYHDFTQEAIAEALSSFLRAHLSEIVHRVARDSVSKETGGAGA